jgi:hypothetical protein
MAALSFWLLRHKNPKVSFLLLFCSLPGLGFFAKGHVVLMVLGVVLAFRYFYPKIPVGRSLGHFCIGLGACDLIDGSLYGRYGSRFHVFHWGRVPPWPTIKKNLAIFLQNDLGSAENVLVYDSRLPSLSFATDKNIISLYDGSDDLNRETQFQKDDRWRENLINLLERPDWLEQDVPARSVLVVKKAKLSKTLEARMKPVFPKRTEIDEWVLFY